jgi:acyl-lipid omega-6 desaturase (Delta-12 desaturase)
MAATLQAETSMPSATPDLADAKRWPALLARYRTPLLARSAVELAITIVPFVILWLLMVASLSYSYVVTLLLALPTAGLLVRLFMIQHDCGHGAFFGRRRLDDGLGHALGVLTLTPYGYWRRTHALHHAGSGNLARRGLGEIETLTVREYRALGRWGRLRYRLYRHPLVMFGVGPLYLFVVQHRLPLGLMRAGWGPWLSTMGTNAALIVLAGLAMWLVGPVSVLLVHLPVVLLAATAGVWLFYVQHQFEETHWAAPEDWSAQHAALHGSSHYDLPAVLRWFTANIGVHHVHHLSSRIPFYRLPQVLRDHPELRSVGRITLGESLGAVRLSLWDEDARQMVGFRAVV